MTVTGSVPFPFITKEGSLNSFKTISSEQFNSDFNYGDVLTGSYPLTASISSDYFGSTNSRNTLFALRNTLNYYSNLSKHYTFSSSLGNKETQDLRLLSVPSIFYGQSIKKGSVSCKWYHSGSLIAELQDVNENGELVQVGPEGSNGSGSVAGVVLYKEGFLLLTGSWPLHNTYVDNFDVQNYPAQDSPAWKWFMTSGSETFAETKVTGSSFILDFDGTEKIPVITMLAHSRKGEDNFSNNPTFVEFGQTTSPLTGSRFIEESSTVKIKNIVSSSFEEEDPDFEKITFISKVAIYDEDRNLIGIAKLANPVRKRQNQDVTIKMKLDL